MLPALSLDLCELIAFRIYPKLEKNHNLRACGEAARSQIANSSRVFGLFLIYHLQLTCRNIQGINTQINVYISNITLPAEHRGDIVKIT